MDDIDYNVTIENSDGSPVTATDVLRAIAESKRPERCPHAVAESVRLMGAWLPGDPISTEEAVKLGVI